MTVILRRTLRVSDNTGTGTLSASIFSDFLSMNRKPVPVLAGIHKALILGCMVVFGIAATPAAGVGAETDAGDSPAPATSEADSPRVPQSVSENDESESFEKLVRPLLTKYCLQCHNAETMKSGIRLDQLEGTLHDRDLFLWRDIRKQLEQDAMPPEDAAQPTEEERRQLSAWIEQAMNTARSKNTQVNGSIRRLTVSQYRNTLRDLLGVEENLSVVLPPDGISKEGFANNGQVMVLSPLQMEYYFDIAEKSLDLCIVDENKPPVIQNFRMDLGAGINPRPCPDELILGADSLLLRNSDFVVTELQPQKPFDYQPFLMRRSWQFIEGYAGNDTVRGMRTFDDLAHSVFACMRGTRGYPRGEAYELAPDGLLLRPAIPSTELFGQSSTYGPMANFKISLRELPEQGNFRVTIRASRYKDAMLPEPGLAAEPPARPDDVTTAHWMPVADTKTAATASVEIPQNGIYQVDAGFLREEGQDTLRLQLGDCFVSTQLQGTLKKSAEDAAAAAPMEQYAAVAVIRLDVGPLKLQAQHGDQIRLQGIRFRRVNEDSELGKRFLRFEQRTPFVGVHLGLRRDCGSTLNPVDEPVAVTSSEPAEFVFEAAINDFPFPAVEKDNLNYLAGIREIGIRSEYTDGRDIPRLRLHSVEFEGPLYETWPPETHRRIFIESANRDQPAVYAGEILRSFMNRAWRRPVQESEERLVFQVWERSFTEHGDFQQSIRDALLVVLTSPQFLFLIENSSSPASEPLDDFELASKLSYFLWNTAPDISLTQAAESHQLYVSLEEQTTRMLHDRHFDRFLQEFISQWLSLDKFDVVETDQSRYPDLTRDTRRELRSEPIHFLKYLIEQNLPLRNIIQSDFIVANDPVARYYDLADRAEFGLQFAVLNHGKPHLGGLLSQAGVLAGLSDGRESNPVKRGAWLARKIIAEPPDDPPPNVPQLMTDDGTTRTLREKLELHRNQDGCRKCHSNIDPWGVPFETFDAGGRRKTATDVDARSTLPDGTEVNDLDGLKDYLAGDRIDQVAFSFLKHLTCYAIGRSLTYNELELLREHGLKLKPSDYRLQDMIRFVISSDLFLKK